jgi:nucleoside-diphosphate-sugar epimerase/SAM-dependent methyltransferase
MNTCKSCCIIGSSGYIGSKLWEYLQRKGYIVYGFKSPREVSFPNHYDAIVYLAGASAPNKCDLLKIVQRDIEDFIHIIENVSNKQKLVYASSGSVYNKASIESKETDNLAFPLTNYDLIKQTIDQLCMLNKANKHVYGLRIGTVNGLSPNFRENLMINKMVTDAVTTGVITIPPHDVHRPILGIDDLCNAIYTIIQNGNIDDSGIYNLCSFNSSTHEIAKRIQMVLENDYNCKVIINTDQNAQTSVYNFAMNNSKFKDTFLFTFKDTVESIARSIMDTHHNEKFTIQLKCRVCNSDTRSLLNLGAQPLANAYLTTTNTIQEKYPLELMYCTNCFHVQISCTVDPKIMFKNYIYVSGTSQTGKDYFKRFGKNVINKFIQENPTANTIRVLDIACNDGSQLDAIKALEKDHNVLIQTVGVDPAENLVDIAKEKGHSMYCAFFDNDTRARLKTEHKVFDIIIAQNVFAHIDYPLKFLEYCKDLTHVKSTIYIQTSQASMIQNSEFDTAYHEHLSFYNTNSMKYLADRSGLTLNKVTKEPIHGGSYVFELRHVMTNDTNVPAVLSLELESGLYSEETYRKYTYNCLMYKNNIHNCLLNYKLLGYDIIGYGSTAKSNTLLNFINADSTIFEFIIDENPLKVGLYTPGTCIPIKCVSTLSTTDRPAVIVVLAWNYFLEIKEKVRANLPKARSNDVLLMNINPIQIHHV